MEETILSKIKLSVDPQNMAWKKAPSFYVPTFYQGGSDFNQ